MARQIKQNEQFLRNISAKGPFQGHGFVCTPPQLGGADHPDYNYTLSDKPVRNWVPQIVENYSRQLKYLEALEDDNVPCARLTTDTHIYAVAFGCPVHRYADSPPAALPLIGTALKQTTWNSQMCGNLLSYTGPLSWLKLSRRNWGRMFSWAHPICKPGLTPRLWCGKKKAFYG
jgi:hypothetical protein